MTAPARHTTRFALKTEIDAVGRIDLATAHDNDGARRLYDRLGGVLAPADYYNFPQSVIRKLAGT